MLNRREQIGDSYLPMGELSIEKSIKTLGRTIVLGVRERTP